MTIPPMGYGLLAALFLAAVLVDFACVKLSAQFLKPASSYVFWAARAGKLLAVALWIAVFTRYWLPQFAPAALQYQGFFDGGTAAVLGLLLLVAGVTLPRLSRGRRERS